MTIIHVLHVYTLQPHGVTSRGCGILSLSPFATHHDMGKIMCTWPLINRNAVYV